MMKRIFARKRLHAAILAVTMTASVSAGLCGLFPMLSANAEDAPAATVDGGYTATRLGALDTITVDGVMDEVYHDAAPIAIDTVTWENNNSTPATATMYLMWNKESIYLFAEVVDDTPYPYQNGQGNIEVNDCMEVVIDLFHDTDNAQFDTAFGEAYRGPVSGNNIAEGYYKHGAGAQGVPSDKINDTYWSWGWLSDQTKAVGEIAQNGDSWISSQMTETGYTMEMKIWLGPAYASGGSFANEITEGKTIGLGAKIYDRHNTTDALSITCIEAKNDNMLRAPSVLSEITLAGTADKPSYNVTETRSNKTLTGYLPIEVDGEDDVLVAAHGANAGRTMYGDSTAINVSALQAAGGATAIVRPLVQSDGMYILAQVTDNTVNNGDTLSLALDFDVAQRDGTETYAAAQDVAVIDIGRDGEVTGQYDYYTDKSADIRSAVVSTDAGYTAEIYLPFPEGYEYELGTSRIGFAAAVTDLNAEGAAVGTAHISAQTQECLGNMHALAVLVATANGANYVTARKEYTATRVLSTESIELDGQLDAAYEDATPFEVATINSGATDTTATVYAVWTNNYLYLFVDVHDANVDTDRENERPEASDSVEIYIDTWNKALVDEQYWGEGYRPNDYIGEGLFRIGAGQQQIRSGFHYMYDQHCATAVSALTETGYTAEFRIDCTGFKAQFPTAEDKLGEQIAIAVRVNDSDANTLNAKGVVCTNADQSNAFFDIGSLDMMTLVANDGETATDFEDFDENLPETPENPDGDDEDVDSDLEELPDDQPTEVPEQGGENKGGCGSTLATVPFAVVGGALILATALVVIRRKKNIKKNIK